MTQLQAFRSKSDEALRFILRDASEAGRCAQDLGDARGVSKYADQVNDAATVLGERARRAKSPRVGVTVE